MQLKLALAQIRIDGGEVAANLQRSLDAVRRAAEAGSDIVLLPEALPCGWTHSSGQHAEKIPGGSFCAALQAAARQHGIYVCSGIVEKDGATMFNSAVLVDPTGEIILHHRKIYELEIAHDVYALGDRLSVAQTDFGKAGVMICADAFAPGQVLSRSLGLMGADIILSPCAWAVPADHNNIADPYGKLWIDNYGPVARDFRMWIAGCSNVGPITDGPWKGRKCIGCSLVIGPDGKPALRGPYGENAEALLFVSVKLEKRPAQGTGWEKRWYPDVRNEDRTD